MLRSRGQKHMKLHICVFRRKQCRLFMIKRQISNNPASSFLFQDCVRHFSVSTDRGSAAAFLVMVETFLDD